MYLDNIKRSILLFTTHNKDVCNSSETLLNVRMSIYVLMKHFRKSNGRTSIYEEMKHFSKSNRRLSIYEVMERDLNQCLKSEHFLLFMLLAGDLS